MLRTLAINSNQIVLSFGVLIAFLSPKQSKIEESYLESMAKKWKAQIFEEQALELHSPLPKSFKVCKERTKERGKTE